ncbi:MAG: hypothetical protein ABIH11_00610 [Candidatus Altiarchaeota archaeon]
MRVFYGAALQGAIDRSERAQLHSELIRAIRDMGFEVATEHATGRTKEEAVQILEETIGPLPPKGMERTRYIRDRMIGFIEGDVSAAVFEVSTPSLGTGIEIAHAYLRPRMGLSGIPVLALYQTGYWPTNLSSMIRGISAEEAPDFSLREYSNVDDARRIISEFLTLL